MSGVRPRSRWSYFRLSADWAGTIVADAQVARGDTVLDLGAGTGALTAPLLARGARVIALEKHPGRAESLRSRFAGQPLVVVEADIRDLRLPARPFRVVANPPFHLARPLVAQLLRAKLLVGADVVLRRDTARRIAHQLGRPGYVVELGRAVPRRAFTPAPTADAAVLRIRRQR
ncbi:rRNA adenine N-6-methyltransferase family protein [Georgenia sp. MJ173]|uniref:rRNA adenine N-6-methyltransferase family protein n=1 Tax=Georgenia sunbinii TaxID=3117728 RepID=UPI002F26780F